MGDGTQEVKGSRQVPVVPAPGLPATDCRGDCCGEHYSLSMVTQLVKAGRKLERQATLLALDKVLVANKQPDVFASLTEIITRLKAGDFTGCKL